MSGKPPADPPRPWKAYAAAGPAWNAPLVDPLPTAEPAEGDFDALTDLFLGEVRVRPAKAFSASEPERPPPQLPVPRLRLRREEEDDLPLPTGAAALDEVDAGVLDAPRTPAPPPSPPKSDPIIECLILGHLPVLGAAWATQYVREVAHAAGRPVAVLRVQPRYASVEVVGAPDDLSRQMLHGLDSLTAAVRAAAGVTDRWILRCAPGEEVIAAASPLVRVVTLLTGGDEAARVGAYASIKDLSGSLPPPPPGTPTPLVRLAIMGSPPDRAAVQSAKVAEAARTFLQRDLEEVVCSGRIGSSRAPALIFSGPIDLDTPGVLSLLEGQLDPDHRLRGDGAPARAPAPADAPGAHDRPSDPAPADPVQAAPEAPDLEAPDPALGVDLLESDAAELPPPAELDENPPQIALFSEPASRGATSAEPEPLPPPAAAKPSLSQPTFSSPAAPEHPAAPAVETPAAPAVLASHLPGLRPLTVRCPYADVELAADAEGALHLLARPASGSPQETAVAALLVAASWTQAHAALLAFALGVPVRGAPTLHLFTDQPKRSRRLLDTDVRVHLLAPVAVSGRTGWFCTELN